MISLSIFLIVLALVFVAKGVIIVQQAEVVIVERLGKFDRVLQSGFNFIIPVLEAPRAIDWKVTQKGFDGSTYSIIQKRTKIDLREAVYDFPRQNVITKDNVSISINALLYFQIVDPKSAVYEIQNLPDAIEKLTQTNLRNLVGQLDLDESLVSRDKINHELRAILDEATNKWGVKVNRVELQDIIPPADIQSAMEKQMNAERNKRALILEAEAQKQSAVTIAEGKKQAAILEAEADKEAKIRRAAGEAQAIKEVAEAKAKEIAMVYDAIKSADPDEKLVQIKSLEALEEIAKGDANKVFIPFEATSALSSLGAVKEILKDDKK